MPDRAQLQAEINELCRQTWHLDTERLWALEPVWGADGRREMSVYDQQLAVEALTKLRDGASGETVRNWLALMLK